MYIPVLGISYFKVHLTIKHRFSSYGHTYLIYCTLAKEGPLWNVGPPPHFVLNFLLRSNVYSNMGPCVAALENAAQMAGL